MYGCKKWCKEGEIMQEKIGAENLQLLTALLAEYGDIIKEVIAAD